MRRLTTRTALAVVPGFTAWALRDAVSRRAIDWDAAGVRRGVWLAAIALVPGVGALAYATRVRPRLELADREVDLLGG